MILVSTEVSRALDLEAQTSWGFNTFSLLEAAGRLSCQALASYGLTGGCSSGALKFTVCAGEGNNGADAMIMLRSWILSSVTQASTSAVLLTRMPKSGETGHWVDIFHSLKKMKVKFLVWDSDGGETAGSASSDILIHSDIIIDGISGTGITGPLSGKALGLVRAINFRKKKNNSHTRFPTPCIVSVDVPSGNFDGWEPGMPIVNADITLAIEPRKYCMYTPAARPFAGTIIPVGGIFPQELIAKQKGAELLTWETAREKVLKIPADAYKSKRGTVEIHSGSAGTTGAAEIAGRGAQAAGAGLIRLIVDDDIYPILASRSGGIMVTPASGGNFFEGRHKPDSILLGPGWGLSSARKEVLDKACALEKNGIPLVLDADAIELAKGLTFSGNAIITPHPGELCKYSGIDKTEWLKRPAPLLLKLARERNAVILLKGHVITIAAPNGRLGVVDGMKGALASGGTGDLLAGFCAAIAARMVQEGNSFDAFTCAAAAATLLIASASSERLKQRFYDPIELACEAANLAGEAWLKEI